MKNGLCIMGTRWSEAAPILQKRREKGSVDINKKAQDHSHKMKVIGSMQNVYTRDSYLQPI